tara:strand:- start:22 stop:207 length:186 start_codon:yes stop_codon:yes gene_type:complete
MFTRSDFWKWMETCPTKWQKEQTNDAFGKIWISFAIDWDGNLPESPSTTKWLRKQMKNEKK